jgi:hypothetical protein
VNKTNVSSSTTQVPEKSGFRDFGNDHSSTDGQRIIDPLTACHDVRRVPRMAQDSDLPPQLGYPLIIADDLPTQMMLACGAVAA